MVESCVTRVRIDQPKAFSKIYRNLQANTSKQLLGVGSPGVVYTGGSVYAVGGFNGSLRVRTVDCYEPVMDRWTSVSSMQDRRSTLGAAVLNGLLYAVGGFDGSRGTSSSFSGWNLMRSDGWRTVFPLTGSFSVTAGLSTVEAYNAKTDEWFHVLPMSTRRSSVGVGVVNGDCSSVFNLKVDK